MKNTAATDSRRWLVCEYAQVLALKLTPTTSLTAIFTRIRTHSRLRSRRNASTYRTGTLRSHPKLRSVCIYLNAIGKKGVPILDQILRESSPMFKIANFQFTGFEKLESTTKTVIKLRKALLDAAEAGGVELEI